MKLHEVLLTEEEIILEGLLDKLAPAVKGFIRTLGSTAGKVMIAALLVASPMMAKAASPDEMKAAATFLSQVPDQQWQQVWNNTVDNASSHGLLQQAKVSVEKLKSFSKEKVVNDLNVVANTVAPALSMNSPELNAQQHPGAVAMHNTMSSVADQVKLQQTR